MIRKILGELADPVWWGAAGRRAVRTAAQVAPVVLVGDAVAHGGFDVASAPWVLAGSYAAGAAVLSLLTSLGGLREIESKGR